MGFVTPVTRVTPIFNDLPRTDLQNEPNTALIREFMEVDGLSIEEAQAMAAISIPVRPASEWLAMIAELDALIEQYCGACRLSGEIQARVLAVRNKQSLASIPGSLAWFKRELSNGRTGA